MTYVFHPSQLETAAMIRENVKEIVSDLSKDYFYSFVDKYTNQKLVQLSSPIKLTLSQNMMKNTYVQRLLSDMGGKLDSFLIQQSRENPIEFEEFLRGRLPKLPEKLDPIHKRISYPVTGITTPTLLEPKKHPNTIPLQNNDPSKSSKEAQAKKRNKSVPNQKNKAGAKEDENGEKNDGPPIANYFTSHLGQNFVQTVGKTEQIRDSLSALVHEMDQNVYYEYMKAKSTWKDVEELFKTKERVVNILEEIVNKEYITAQEMADDMGENWDVTEEYEKIISDMITDHNKEKEALKQRYEKRIYSLKENTIAEINELKQEISELRALNAQKAEEYHNSNQAKDYEIEILSGKVTIMQTQIYKLEERVKRAPNPNSSKVSNRDTLSKAGSEFTRKGDTQRSKLISNNLQDRPNSRMSGSTLGNNHKTKKPSHLRPPQIHIQNIEEVQMHEQNFIQENLLDITSINEDERSRLSLSSRDVSGQQLMSVSRKVSEDWLGDEETRKIRALRGFFLKLYEKVLIKKGGSVDSHTSFEGSDDESNVEDFGLEMYDIVLKQMANPELCEAAGVRPMTSGGLIGENKHSVRKKMPLLFTKKKRPTLAVVEPIEEKIKEENKDDKLDATLITLENDNGPHTGFRGTQRVFEGCKDDLLDILESIINDKLPAHTRQLPIPRLFEQEVPLDLEKMLTIDNFKEKDDNKILTEYVVVTVEQLIMNALNFYVSLLHEKTDLVKVYQVGKRYFGKLYQNAGTDTSGLSGNGVKKNQAMQTDGPVHFEVEVNPEQILQDSLVSWKKRLEDVRNSRPQRSNYTSFDRGSSPKNHFFMTQTSSKFDFKPRTPAENIHTRLKNRASHNFSVYESRKMLESGEQSRDEPISAVANKSFYYTTKPPSQENLQKERAFWKNILPDELFSRHQSKPHNAVEPAVGENNIEVQASQTQTKMKLAPVNMATTVLEMPFQEKAIPKKEEIRNKILMEKSKFISYKNEENQFKPRLESSVESVKVKRETNRILGKESPDEISELCKRTVIALHDYIVNIQKDITNQTRMKFDLTDINKKVGEIEEMLHFGLADKKYVALIDHFQKQGVRPETIKDSEITAYLQEKRNELRYKVKEALESHLIPTLSKNLPSDNSSLLLNQRETQGAFGFQSAQKPRNNSLANQNVALFMSDSKLEGFARETESSQFEFESRNSPRLPSFRSRGETRESPLKNQTPLIKEESQGNRILLDNPSSVKELQKAEQEQAQAPVQNYHSISGNPERDQVLKRLSISHQVHDIMNGGKLLGGEKAKKDREHRQVKKAAFKVKRLVTPSKEKALNKTIL